MISSKREQLVNESLRKANAKRRSYDYAVGDRVLKKIWKPTKLGPRTEGPYTVTRVHTNGNVTLQLKMNTGGESFRSDNPHQSPHSRRY